MLPTSRGLRATTTTNVVHTVAEAAAAAAAVGGGGHAVEPATSYRNWQKSISLGPEDVFEQSMHCNHIRMETVALGLSMWRSMHTKRHGLIREANWPLHY